MKKLYYLLFVTLTSISFAQTNVGITGNVDGVYINEIHYDNTGTDIGEFIEVAGISGTDLSAYTITLYSANNSSYNTLVLSGVIDDEGNGVGAVSFNYPVDGIQNGAPDGIALSKTGSTDIQYLSYEGVMDAPATDGPAAGLNSVDIIAVELNTAAVGSSLDYNENSSSWENISDDTPGVFAQATLGVQKNTISGLKIYPNPVLGDRLFINTNANALKEVTIFDVLGKQVLKTVTTENTVNVANLKSGVYIVKITEERKTATRKLVIK